MWKWVTCSKRAAEIIVRKKIEKTKKLSCKAVGEKYHWICREIDFYYFDGHWRYHLNKNLEKYDSACGQLKKKEGGKKIRKYMY